MQTMGKSFSQSATSKTCKGISVSSLLEQP